MKICISNTVVEFDPSEKIIKKEEEDVETRSFIVNTTSECLLLALAT